jgi:hypothetical protein
MLCLLDCRTSTGDELLSRDWRECKCFSHAHRLSHNHVELAEHLQFPGTSGRCARRLHGSDEYRSLFTCDVVGLYVDPPANAAVLSIDKKSQIRAPRVTPGLDRTCR